MQRTGTTWTTDVAGVAVGVSAFDAIYDATARARLGDVPTTADPALEVVVGPDIPQPPADLEPHEVEGYLGWERDGGLWIGNRELVVAVRPGSVVVGGAITDGPSEDRFDDLLQFGVAAALAGPDLVMLHAAVVARGDSAALVVGGSGAGKSTLAGAAIVGGWDLLGDDLCVYRLDEGTVEAVARTPYVPGEIADRHGLAGVRAPGTRDRVRLPVDVLASGRRRLVGVILVEHGDEGAVVAEPAGDLEVFDSALPVPPFPYVLRRHLRAAGAFLELPAVRLEHARDIDRRVERAIELLDDAWEELTTQ